MFTNCSRWVYVLALIAPYSNAVGGAVGATTKSLLFRHDVQCHSVGASKDAIFGPLRPPRRQNSCKQDF